jgi:DUF1009 family protein
LKLGIIAGNRNFPSFYANGAKDKNNIELIGIGFKGITEDKFAQTVDKMYWIGLGQLGKLIDIFQNEQIKEAVMVGQIPPTLMYKALHLDMKGMIFMSKIKSMQSKGILGALADEIEQHGIKMISSVRFIEHHLADLGQMGHQPMSEKDEIDLEFAKPIVKSIVDLDIGQTVVVKKKAIVAVEALEGTDQTLLRAKDLIQKKGGIVFKLAMTHQDNRFDVPIIGQTTIENIYQAGLTSLIVSAKKTLLLDKEKIIQLADKRKIALVGIE